MPKLKTSCAVVLYKKVGRTIFPNTPKSIATVNCGTGKVVVNHTWMDRVILNIPVRITCQAEIATGLAGQLNFIADLTTDYPFTAFKVVDRDKCFDTEYKFYTVFDQYDLRLVPLVNGRPAPPGEKGTLYVPVDTDIRSDILLTRFCCIDPDDFDLALLERPIAREEGAPLTLASLSPVPAGEVALPAFLPPETFDLYAQSGPEDVIAFVSEAKQTIFFVEDCLHEAIEALGAEKTKQGWRLPDSDLMFDVHEVSGPRDKEGGVGQLVADEPQECDRRVKRNHRCGPLQPARPGRCRPFINNTFSKLDRDAFAVCQRRTGETCVETFKEFRRIKIYSDRTCKKLIAEIALLGWLCGGGKDKKKPKKQEEPRKKPGERRH